jgi:drug/metabolite transporter (DMT)-like permease
MLLAIPLLGERVGPWRWAAAAIALAGALVLLRPGGAALAVGALLALGAAVALGLEVIFLKRLSGLERPFQLLLVNNLIGLGIASVAVLAVWQAPTAGQWAALIGVGLAMAVAQSCFLNAVARADASFVAPFSYATLVWAAAYDAAVFGVLPDAVSWAGAGMILGGAALLAWREAGRARRPRGDPGPGPGAAG